MQVRIVTAAFVLAYAFAAANFRQRLDRPGPRWRPMLEAVCLAGRWAFRTLPAGQDASATTHSSSGRTHSKHR